LHNYNLIFMQIYQLDMPRWKKKVFFFFLLDLDEYTAEMEQRITYQNNILTINLYIIKKKNC